MADDLKQRGAPDRHRVSVQPHEVKWAAKAWQVRRDEAREAIKRSGPSRKKVAAALGKAKSR